MSVRTDSRTGNYYIDLTVRVPGEPKPRRIKRWLPRGATKKAAESLEREIRSAAATQRIEDLRRGGYVRDEKAVPVPFSGMAARWFEQSVQVHRARSYQRTTEQVLRVHLVAHFGDRDMRGITKADVAAYVVAKTRAGLSSKTIFNQMIALRQVFAQAREHGFDVGNPCAGVKLSQSQAHETEWLTEVQARAFLAAAEHSESEWHPLFYTALATGMRQGELIGLKWTAIDFERRVIRVLNNRVLGQDGPTKTRKARTIDMRPGLVKLLRNLPRRGDYVFCDAAGHPVTPDMIKRPFARALAAARVPQVRFHDLRHSFASQLVCAGVPLYAVSKLLGHSTIKTTERYAHLAPSALREVVCAVDLDGPRLTAIEGGRAG